MRGAQIFCTLPPYEGGGFRPGQRREGRIPTYEPEEVDQLLRELAALYRALSDSARRGLAPDIGLDLATWRDDLDEALAEDQSRDEPVADWLRHWEPEK